MRKFLASMVGVVALVAAAPAFSSPGTLYVPRLHVFAPIASSLNDGPIVFYRDSDTLAIAAHRTEGPHLFYNLNLMKKGDLIRAAGRNYHVVRLQVVSQYSTWVLNWKGLILSACSEPNGLPTNINYRLIVFAR